MKYNKQGFTLIELLVTIAIISLLSSIVFASVSSARDKANVVKAMVQGKEIEKAIELSRLSNNSLPTNTSVSDSIQELVISGSELSVKNAIEDYYSGSVPEVDSSVAGIDGNNNKRDYYYISNGDEAVDGNGAGYMCGLKSLILGDAVPDESVIFYRDKNVLFLPQDVPLEDGLAQVDDTLYYARSNTVTIGAIMDSALTAVGSLPTYEISAPVWNDDEGNPRYFRCIK